MNASWLWSGVGFPEWLAQVSAQVAVGFLLIGAVLTPLWRWAPNPFSRGGAGSRRVADGREVHEVLAPLAPTDPKLGAQ